MTFRKIILIFIILSACSKTKDTRLFELISNDKSNINFNNTLNYTENLNPYTYRNFYNGGGVAIGDFNNDSLQDIFFAGNLVSNKLYLNKGNLSFQDITEQSGLESSGVWSTGVSVVDINSDGYLDIYVCKSGPPGGERRYNELFINNGDYTVFDSGYQIQRTSVGKGYSWHDDFDLKGMNGEDGPRYLTFIWYLNTVDEGWTQFHNGNQVAPKQGRLLPVLG